MKLLLAGIIAGLTLILAGCTAYGQAGFAAGVDATLGEPSGIDARNRIELGAGPGAARQSEGAPHPGRPSAEALQDKETRDPAGSIRFNPRANSEGRPLASGMMLLKIRVWTGGACRSGAVRPWSMGVFSRLVWH
jgi:hypothetical protein